MPVRSYQILTDHDFEVLIADLFGVADSVRYEVFARGPDLGVDLRHIRDDGSADVVQCKNYARSRVSDLRVAARRERKSLGRLASPPATYRLVTSLRLTAENKRKLRQDLDPFIIQDDDIWGEDDLELLLGQHPEVERRHIKLWLPSSAQLDAVVHSGTYAMSRVLVEETVEALPLWVPTRSFYEARAILREIGLCVIAGIPGIGKTTLAKMLLADAIHDGYEAIQISGDVRDAWNVYNAGTNQVFYYDDFLGRNALTGRELSSQEDKLVGLMERAIHSPSTLFILTTREYILQQAHKLYERLEPQRLSGKKVLLELRSYSRLERARIFYNHVYFSDVLSKGARRSLLRNRVYERIIDHEAYNPRQIEWITGFGGHPLTPEDNKHYVKFAVEALDDPTRIWRYGFEQQLNDQQRGLLLALASMPDRTVVEDLATAFNGYCMAAGIATRVRAFDRALKVVDDSFVRTYMDVGELFVTVYNPSIDDFLAQYLQSSRADALVAIHGAVFFEELRKIARILAAPQVPDAAYASDFVSGVMRAAKNLFVSSLHYAGAFGDVLVFHDAFPEAFTEQEWEDIRESFRETANGELNDWLEIRDVDQVDDIERYARRLNVELDAELVARTRERVLQSLAEAEAAAAESVDEEDLEEEPPPVDEGREIEALFARLAER